MFHFLNHLTHSNKIWYLESTLEVIWQFSFQSAPGHYKTYFKPKTKIFLKREKEAQEISVHDIKYKYVTF